MERAASTFLDRKEVGSLAREILHIMLTLEIEHPYLNRPEYGGYETLKTEILHEETGSIDDGGVAFKEKYLELIDYLKGVNKERETMLSVGRKPSKKPQDYFAVTFEQFVGKFRAQSVQKHLDEDLHFAAEALILNELEGGFESIVPEHRGAVKIAIIRALINDVDQQTFIEDIVAAFGIDNIIELLEKNDDELEAIVEKDIGDIMENPASSACDVLITLYDKPLNCEEYLRGDAAQIIMDARLVLLENFGSQNRHRLEAAARVTKPPAQAKVSHLQVVK